MYRYFLQVNSDCLKVEISTTEKITRIIQNDFERNLRELINIYPVKDICFMGFAIDIECDFAVTNDLSLIDKHLLKKNWRNGQENCIAIGANIIKKIKPGNNDGKHFEFERILINTKCILSDASKRVIEFIKEEKFPIKNIDVLQNFKLKSIIKSLGIENIKSNWLCIIVIISDMVTILVSLRDQLVIIRNVVSIKDSENVDITEQINAEIVQTFKYLSRTGYNIGEDVTLVYQKTLEKFYAKEFIEKNLNCDVYIENFEETEGTDVYTKGYCEGLKYNRNIFIFPKILKYFSLFSIFFLCTLSCNNFYLAFREEHFQKKELQDLNLAEFPLDKTKLLNFTRQIKEETALMNLWNYNNARDGFEKSFPDLFCKTLEKIHKGKFLIDLNCKIENKTSGGKKSTPKKNFIFNVNFTPAGIYGGGLAQKKIPSFVKKSAKETLNQVRAAFKDSSQKPKIKIKAKTKEKTLNVEMKFYEPEKIKAKNISYLLKSNKW